jgi:SAM-dependent methyltransferase
MRSVTAPCDFRGRDFDSFDLRSFLDRVLPRLPMSARPRAFEYGTGTGPGACYVAARGYSVDAVDSSPEAIELARRFARDLGLEVHFEVADITRMTPRVREYDLVIDGFCLQNLIADSERRSALVAVATMLRPEGHYVIGTSVFGPARSYGDGFRDERTGIVFMPLPPGDYGYEDAVRIDGRWFYPHVRHVRPDELRDELEAAGFRVLEQIGGRVLCCPVGMPLV